MKCSCGSEMVLRTSKFNSDLYWACSRYPACRETKRFSEVEIAAQSWVFRPTPEQQEIFKFVRQRAGNLLIQAVAGSGKTSTILEALKYLPEGQQSIFMAFNKSIAETLSAKAPSYVDVRTLHSLGFRCIRRRYPKIAIHQSKMAEIVEAIIPKAHAIQGVALKLHSLSVNNDASFTVEAVEDLAAYYNIDLPESAEYFSNLLEQMEDHAYDLYSRGISVSFDEMIQRPAWDSALCLPFDNIFVDEVQDLNRIQIKFICNCVGPDTMVVGVGDRAQSIYGFRGADASAMDNLKERLKAHELPLSICFRCPRSHIAMAQMFVPQITARGDAPAGTVTRLQKEQMVSEVKQYDLVISRFNAPLVPLALSLVSKGKAACILGRDIAQSITTLLQREVGKDVATATEHLVVTTNRKVDKLMEQGKTTQATNLLDICDCAVYFLEYCGTVSDAIEKVPTLFTDYRDGITLSSIHKAKGLEASRVFVINFDRRVNTRSAWEHQQEDNLRYVALTRAKESLYFVEV